MIAPYDGYKLMENSDAALYAAKENGRACHMIHAS